MRVEERWNGRYLTDKGTANNHKLPDEIHRLWGQASDPPGPQNGFTLMRDGIQGLLHALPLTLTKDKRAVLQVRHYLDYDEQGQAYIALSRLVKLEEAK